MAAFHRRRLSVYLTHGCSADVCEKRAVLVTLIDCRETAADRLRCSSRRAFL